MSLANRLNSFEQRIRALEQKVGSQEQAVADIGQTVTVLVDELEQEEQHDAEELTFDGSSVGRERDQSQSLG